MNTEGMLPYENEIADYVENTGNHVAYQVEPLFKGKELLARGVHMQAESIEDDGEGVSFNVFCYNVQPDVDIDYMTGESEPADGSDGEEVYDEPSDKADAETSEKADQDKEQKSTYILNTNTKKYHIPGCRSLNQMKDKNKKSFRGSKEDLQNKGYSPCGNCHP
jgi:DNA-entry nuclease